MIVAAWLAEIPAHALELQHAPLKVGQPTTLVATGATPGATVGFVHSLAGAGAGPCPPALGGLCLGVVSPILAGTAVANAQGVAVLQIRIPAAAPLVDVALQAAQGGASPQLSAPVSSPLLGELVGDVYLDLTHTADALRHLWRIEGTLATGVAGPFALTLPHLEELDALEIGFPSTDVTIDLPALDRLGAASFNGVGAVTVDLPALVSWADDPTAPVRPALSVASVASFTLRAHELTHASWLQVTGAGPTELDLPALLTVGGLTLSSLGGPLVVGLPVLDRVQSPVPSQISAGPDVLLANLAGTTVLDVLPSLTRVEGGVFVTQNPDLVS